MTGRVAVVTGAAGGIGSALVTALDREGISVAAWDLRPGWGEGVSVEVDITSRASVAQALHTTEERLGPDTSPGRLSRCPAG